MMQSLITEGKRLSHLIHKFSPEPLQRFYSKVRAFFVRFGEILAYMGSEVKKHLPEWRQDVREYKQEKKENWDHFKEEFRAGRDSWRRTFSTLDASPEKLHQMLFEDKTLIGRRFEEVLIVLILASVLVVMLDSVSEIHAQVGGFLKALEWFFTIVFTIEYILRIYSSPHPIRYITSFYGIIDLITILPTYIYFIFPEAHTFLILRILRVFRVFRLLKLVKMMQAGSTITAALKASRAKIYVFLIFVLLSVTIMGSVLYIVEAGEDSGFTSIPNSIYWAIVTLTTVGYGDIAPATWVGRFIAACIMIIGYSVIAVPTGIVSAEFVSEKKKNKKKKQDCFRCGKHKHETNARYCSRCGERLLGDDNLKSKSRPTPD